LAKLKKILIFYLFAIKELKLFSDIYKKIYFLLIRRQRIKTFLAKLEKILIFLLIRHQRIKTFLAKLKKIRIFTYSPSKN